MFSVLALFLATTSVVTARVVRRDTADGFPNPNATQLEFIENLADGTLSDAPPPPSLNESSIPIFQLINFNENFEVAFFTSLIENITTDEAGFTLPTEKKEQILDILTTVLAQEQLHAIDAANILKHFNASLIPEPCTYIFPGATDINSSIALAATFTDVVLGTLQDAAEGLATNGDLGPIREVASIIGQEGQQSGFYRLLLNQKPSEKPFLTTNVGAFAWSALQQFVVSCPFNISEIEIPIFPPLQVTNSSRGPIIEPRNQRLSFVANLTGSSEAEQFFNETDPDLFVTYFSGQLLPISVSVQDAQWFGENNTHLRFGAEFPFEENILVGLTIAALTTKDNFTSYAEVVNATIAAPGLIEVVDGELSWNLLSEEEL
ncbi:hypothetical protein QBC40DRAFT_231969 [Triangularia verruculosa]|uniref:Sexual development protein n=1 Tax=Triangularia verruculosa TaxID=2587418 RepID=A0AAN7ASJ9_9PEZI|nr:hypothetical protein QBC40DRAFT_231969 [Triangularia verruculosa]